MVYVLLHSLTITSNLSIYTFFVMEVIYLLILFFNVLINLCNHDYIDLLQNSFPLPTNILVGLRPMKSSKNF